MADLQATFMCIPSEIRLLIYEELFQIKRPKVFEIRNHDPEAYRGKNPHRRTQYRVLMKDLTRQSKVTTYQLITDCEIHTSIMAVNRQIYDETVHMLYYKSSFSFSRDIEAIIPFFTDLSPSTRSMIYEVSLLKQGSIYTRDYDRCEWANACQYLTEHMQIQSLNLVVEGGRPAIGWKGLPDLLATDFKTLHTIIKYEPLDWVWELLKIKGLQKLEVGSIIHHCSPSLSNAMTFYANFSASIEKGFADFLKEEMLSAN